MTLPAQPQKNIDPPHQSASKKPTKSIELDERRAGPPPILTLVRNACVGMALIYLERLDMIFQPLAFIGRHLGTYAAALLHILVPLLAAWVVTHWSEHLETALLGGSPIDAAASFAAAWLIMLIAWSIIWLGLRSALMATLTALSYFSQERRPARTNNSRAL